MLTNCGHLTVTFDPSVLKLAHWLLLPLGMFRQILVVLCLFVFNLIPVDG